mmetsp:Transcript_49976/g.80625  ORF Transcript_49976/g.80625 Transcript_49976/m.80625 type:complete len:371 (-) Transcript_49976:1709-2821(-)
MAEVHFLEILLPRGLCRIVEVGRHREAPQVNSWQTGLVLLASRLTGGLPKNHLVHTLEVALGNDAWSARPYLTVRANHVDIELLASAAAAAGLAVREGTHVALEACFDGLLRHTNFFRRSANRLLFEPYFLALQFRVSRACASARQTRTHVVLQIALGYPNLLGTVVQCLLLQARLFRSHGHVLWSTCPPAGMRHVHLTSVKNCVLLGTLLLFSALKAALLVHRALKSAHILPLRFCQERALFRNRQATIERERKMSSLLLLCQGPSLLAPLAHFPCVGALMHQPGRLGTHLSRPCCVRGLYTPCSRFGVVGSHKPAAHIREALASHCHGRLGSTLGCMFAVAEKVRHQLVRVVTQDCQLLRCEPVGILG